MTKIAEVAGKRIKKLRRNWSLKKDDISKGLSKIKRSSKTLIEDVYNSREGVTFISNIYEKKLIVFFSQIQFCWETKDILISTFIH